MKIFFTKIFILFFISLVTHLKAQTGLYMSDRYKYVVGEKSEVFDELNIIAFDMDYQSNNKSITWYEKIEDKDEYVIYTWRIIDLIEGGIRDDKTNAISNLYSANFLENGNLLLRNVKILIVKDLNKNCFHLIETRRNVDNCAQFFLNLKLIKN